MYIAHTALAAACVIVLVKGQNENADSQENINENESAEKPDLTLNGNHTFVALIDIVFTDSTKRTCTGAIVHDNVVITAAHCFLGNDESSNSKPELTASFVVIGTKKMFDTGYEQYLPIERIVVHPKFEGWTADVALVFTFAGMTSDKPGTVIPLAGEKSTSQLDANVTVFSWGHARRNPVSSEEAQADPKKYEKYKNVEVTASDESCASDIENKGTSRISSKSRPTMKRNTVGLAGKRFWNEKDAFNSSPHRFKKKRSSRKYRQHMYRSRHERAQEGHKDFETQTSIISRYLTVIESSENLEFSIKPYVFDRNESYESIEKKLNTRSLPKMGKKEKRNPHDTINASEQTSQEDDTVKQKAEKEWNNKKNNKPRILYSFKAGHDWRRSMGSQHNRLLVENFNFVNLHACRVLVEKALPPKYNISKYNDVICYTNVDRCADEKDSGAPAVRQGQLVAITVGGAECEGDHVAVGMRMACYCSWISDNLPPGSTKLSCCKNCCDVKHKEEKKKERRHRFRNRFI